MESENYKILAVDDNPKNLKVLAALLSSHSYAVDYAFSGAEALKFLAAEEYDLVLLDIMMPEMDGFETCLRIREDARHKDLPVIFLTAKTEIESITEAFRSGGFDYVTKPFRSAELLARVNTHIELKRLRKRQKELNRWLEEQVSQRTEELVQTNTKLEEANHELQVLDKAKNEFLRMINHEIRTPLNAILGFTDILKTQLKSSEIFEFVEYLDIASLRLEKFLMVVLQITELRTKNRPIEKEQVSLNQVISAAKERMSEGFTAKNIKPLLSANLINLFIPGNFKLLQSCFECLLENAVTHSEENGEITIQANEISEQVIVEIIDQGNGFSQQALNTLFRIFAIGEQHVDQNAGLGLALVKLIMDAHHGEVQINNNPGRGATVRLLFRKS
jgi:two-component system sensor histidine kinase/response regulator